MTTATQPVVSAEFAIGVREMFLQTLEREIPVTRKVIASVPENKKEWRPDPKARNAWELVAHLANSDVWFLHGIADHHFPQDPPLAAPAQNVADTAAWYEESMKSAMERVRRMSPEQLLTPVDFYGAYKLPAFAYLEFCLKHSVHHRAQLGTYLRPMGSTCPSIYGGSADEPWQG
jgi:uncharacterized damage-inducible protein DinB